MVAWDEEQLAKLPAIVEKAHRNGVADVVQIDRDELRKREPHLSEHGLGAVHVPGEHIIDPWSAPLAYAHQGLAHGGKILRRCRVTGGAFDGARWTLQTTLGDISAGVVINAAGNHGDLVEAINQPPAFAITPRKGQFVVFDKPASKLLHAIILPVPTERTKGVVACRTAFGNLLVGPTAEDQQDRDRAEVDHAMLEQLIAKGVEMIPGLAHHSVNAIYAGLRPATQFKDYQIAVNRERRWITAAGIRSTGLTSALGIAQMVGNGFAETFGDMRDGGADLDPGPQPRRGAAAPIHDRGRRRHRVPLRAGDARRDRGRARRPAARRRPRRIEAAHALHDGPLPGLLLQRPGAGDGGGPIAAMTSNSDVLILGGGPAGLSCARALRGLGIHNTVLLERESALGGIPRHCGHLGFGLREFGKVYSGPDYAKRLADEASGADLKLRMSALKLEPGGLVRATGPNGPEDFQAKAVVLAFGARETPRSARLISGGRPFGVMNTGALQQFVYLHGKCPFERPVVIGSELVAFSTLLTLRHANLKPLAIIEENARITARAARQVDRAARLRRAGPHQHAPHPDPRR